MRLGVLIIAVFLATGAAHAQWDISGQIDLDARIFPQSPKFADQHQSTISPSIALRPEAVYEWNEGDDRLTFEMFYRADMHDEARTHFDVREAHWLHFGPDWDVTVGVSKVFWGVTESLHLVDIINQTDFIEDIDNEDKLGQPMVSLSLLRDWGTLRFFVLPGFRERTFPGDDARRRGPIRIEAEDASYESGAEEWHVDYAIRWAHTFGNWDVGVSHFYGTSREPRLTPSWKPLEGIRLRPHYDLIHQTGIDIQYTKDAWLWKFEAIARWGHGDPFIAAVGGFEYTFFGVRDSNVDVGVLAELQFDGRNDDGSAPITIADNDLFVGTRIALNDEKDTTFLAGGIVDLDDGTSSVFLEASRRIDNSWLAEIEARIIAYSDDENVLEPFSRDSSVTLGLSYSF